MEPSRRARPAHPPLGSRRRRGGEREGRGREGKGGEGWGGRSAARPPAGARRPTPPPSPSAPFLPARRGRGGREGARARAPVIGYRPAGGSGFNGRSTPGARGRGRGAGGRAGSEEKTQNKGGGGRELQRGGGRMPRPPLGPQRGRRVSSPRL